MSWRDLVKVHPAADAFPMMSEAELRTLGEDIKANGLRNPIVLSGASPAVLLDGRNRLDAMELAGLPTHDDVGLTVITRLETSEKDPAALAASLNLHRRHLTQEQKRDAIAKLLKGDPAQSNRAIAGIVKANDKTVGALRQRLELGAEIPHLGKRTGRDGRTQSTDKQVAAVVVKDSPVKPTPVMRVEPAAKQNPADAPPTNRQQVFDLILRVQELTTEQRRSFWNLCAQKWPEPMKAALTREHSPR